MLEVALAAAFAALIGSELKERRLISQNKKLLHDNNRMTSTLALSTEEYEEQVKSYQHKWGPSHEDVIYRSTSLISKEAVVVRTVSCEKCMLVHRHIVRGLSLANRKGIDVDGFYLGGTKVFNSGCSVPDKTPDGM